MCTALPLKLEAMKKLWAQTLAWITAVGVALLFAVLGPDAADVRKFLLYDSVILSGSN